MREADIAIAFDLLPVN